MTLTKLDMAKVVVQALYALKALPADDDRRVCRFMKAKKEVLVDRYKAAHKILTDRVAGGR